jgi:putative oxidoreductase
MTKWLNSLQPFGALLLRLALGVAMIVHGYGKVIPHGALNHHAHYIASLGIPYWLGYVSAFTEFAGGILLIIGFLTRFAAFMISIDMAVAISFVNRHHGYSGSEYSLALFVIAAMLVFYGAGALALDRKIGFA